MIENVISVRALVLAEVLIVASALVFFYFVVRRSIRGKRSPARRQFSGIATSMPLDFLRPENRKLREIPAEEAVWIDFTSISVDPNGKTYVYLDAKVHEEPTITSIRVFVDRDGYRLTLPKGRITSLAYTPRQLSSMVDYGPVIAITVEETSAAERNSGR